MSGFGCIILAAGKGTRFFSDTPKVLHDLHGKPVLQHVLETAESAGFRRPIVVVGRGADELSRFLKNRRAVPVVQKRQLGTADAVKSAERQLSKYDDIAVLYGDVPLVREETLRSLVASHKASGASCTVLTVDMADPSGYGRIVRGISGGVEAIVEEKEASAEERKIREINVGLCCFDRRDLFGAIRKIRRSRVKKEYYLTDAVAILISSGKRVRAFKTGDPDESIGMNSRSDLANAYSIMSRRKSAEMNKGSVTVLDPASTFIAPDVKIGRDTVIYPFTVIEKGVVIGRRCSIGPFCRLRPGTVIEDGAEVGNFVEIVRSTLGPRSKAKHLTYLGDSVIGKGANIGCGTITANYDGRKKSKTSVGDKAFIGSGTVLVAPVKIGSGAITGAGSVVLKNKNVPARKVAVGVPARILDRSKNKKGKR
ncbi:MAG TPA: NTP transferase domain-containing protein [Candidatus Omnitrophota bacterium]|nr:bifunctional N-acetylglucosamine-1-phosphate uridyltransferase/glucosamine-1-phosphate acetyltransferase [Candidatus Omnitrophota bacterium]HOX10064.1 NTP transferase domain-containing protein [Candidatus Omnitrophota bacterium]HRZ66957.1 NTP transferase domain-containing protein [Candidatus Omnitrophota bacterium]